MNKIKVDSEATIRPVIESLEGLFSKLNERFFSNDLERPVISIWINILMIWKLKDLRLQMNLSDMNFRFIRKVVPYEHISRRNVSDQIR
jgi:hypothetical protein